MLVLLLLLAVLVEHDWFTLKEKSYHLLLYPLNLAISYQW
jgi:hypothetical protein